MKKFLLLLVAALIAIAPADAQVSRRDVRRAVKSAKKEAKAYKKEGFKLLETGLMEAAIADFNIKKKAGNITEIVTQVNGKKSINMAKSQARNNAINEYAESARALIRGRVDSDMSDVGEVQMENFVAAYERLVLKEMNGELMTAFSLVRENKSKKAPTTYDIRLVSYVDLDAAHQAHMRAMEQAMRESDLAKKYGTKISSWIDEGFVKELAK